MERSMWFILYVGALVGAFATLWWPMGQDQGIYAWVGDVICAGGLPYRDAWELKGPATHYTYASVQAILGRNEWGIRVADVMFVCVGAIGLWRLVDRLGGYFAAHSATILMIYWYARGGYWDTAQPDGWAAMLIVWAMAIALDRDAIKVHTRLAIGALIAVAGLYKWIFAGFLLLPLGIEAVRWQDSLALRLRSAAIVVGGFAVVVMSALAWFFFQGGLAELIEVQVVFNRDVHATLHHRGFIDHVVAVGRFLRTQPMILALFVPLGAFVQWQRDGQSAAILLLWTTMAVLMISVQDKYYIYHWILVYAPVAALAGLGVAELRERLRVTTSNWPGRVSNLCALWFVGWTAATVYPAEDVGHVLSYVTGQRSREAYFAKFEQPGGNFSSAADRQVAEYLREHTAEEDTVVVWGFEPLVNYLAGRSNPTRFGFNYPLVVGMGTRYFENYRREFLDKVSAAKPKYIVTVDRDLSNQNFMTSKAAMAKFPSFESFLRDHYQLEIIIEDFELWKRS